MGFERSKGAAVNRQIQLLASAPLFQSMSERELEEVLGLGQEVEYAAGQPITEVGMAAMDFYLILEGEARLDVPDIRTETIGSGSTFGEMAVLDGGLRSASVTAISHVLTLRIGRPEFIALLDRHGSISRKLLVEVSARLRRAEDQARGRRNG